MRPMLAMLSLFAVLAPALPAAAHGPVASSMHRPSTVHDDPLIISRAALGFSIKT